LLRKKNCDEYITSEMKKLGYEKQLPGEILCEEEFEIFPFGKTEEKELEELHRKTEFSFTYLWIIPGNKEEALKTARFRGPLIQVLPPVRQIENCLSEKHIGEIEVGKSKAKVYYCTPQDEIGEAYFTLFEFEEDERVKTVICFSTNLKEMRKIIEEALRWEIKCLRNS